ncbi:hypothetical protein KIN20_025142 [Parelaphostrongylus tenuis]|uniref:Uncharacterized protein n=1 Tax=Parelaphostrongylus tenuis TaxID=148309 RepID=A0AAD5QWG7_PARTN|nr:hypothetical protein KIN20_025142 [Parelaphostrongylus tenuis]
MKISKQQPNSRRKFQESPCTTDVRKEVECKQYCDPLELEAQTSVKPPQLPGAIQRYLIGSRSDNTEQQFEFHTESVMSRMHSCGPEEINVTAGRNTNKQPETSKTAIGDMSECGKSYAGGDENLWLSDKKDNIEYKAI